MVTVTSNRTPSEQAALDLIRLRKQAYAHVFKEDDRFVQVVLADLGRFGRANQSTFHIDQRMNDVLTGRREIVLRIADHMGLDERELYEKYVLGK
jgi:hypothetical protein